MKSLSILLIIAVLSGCAQLGAKITRVENGVTTTMSEKAFMTEKLHAAEATCYESRAIKVPDNPTQTQLLGFAFASMAAQNLPPCGGTNMNDVAIAKTKARWGFANSALRTGLSAYGVGKLADFGETLATTKGDITTYNTDIQTPAQSTSFSGVAGDAGEFGEGGAFNVEKNGIESNSINIGSNVSLAGERSAAGATALVNGDSSVISAVDDSRLIGSDTGEDITKPDSVNTAEDNDGGNGTLGVDF